MVPRQQKSHIEQLLPCPTISTLYQNVQDFTQPGVGIHCILKVSIKYAAPGFHRLLLVDKTGDIYGRLSDNVSTSVVDTLQEIHGRVIKEYNMNGAKIFINILSMRRCRDQNVFICLCKEWELYQIYRDLQTKRN